MTTDYKVTDTELIAVADAIRTKGGTSAVLEWPTGYIDAIDALPGGGGGVTIVPFSSGTDEEIVAMIQAAHNGDIDLQQDGGWAVGDVRTISVSAFTGGGSTAHAAQNVDIVITSFDDYQNCGCVMQFDFKGSLAEGQRFNSSGTNAGGYGSSEMKTTTLPALVNALPTWLKDSLIEFSCLASAGNRSSSIVTVTGNKLALRSEIEVFGNVTNSYSGEGSHIPYYNNYLRRKKNMGSMTYADYWWERSPGNYSDNGFCDVDGGGNPSADNATNTRGLSPFGCL